MNAVYRHKMAVVGAVAFAIASVGATSVHADDEPDRVALAAMLLRDGHVDRAAAELEQISPDDKGANGETIDKAQYYTLRGVISLRRKLWAPAAAFLQAAIQAGQKDPLARVFLAQAYAGSKRYKEALGALDAAGEAGRKTVGTWMLRARCWRMLGDKKAAYAALVAGGTMFPKSIVFARRRVLLLVELGLFQAAQQIGKRLFAHPDATAADRLAVAEGMRRSGAHLRAAALLEDARLRYPHDRATAVLLARCWLDAGKIVISARRLDAASMRWPKLAVEAAELYRRAGMLNRALRTNARVLDPARKLRQRIGLLIELERYEAAATMAPALAKQCLQRDDELRYALAYAQFRSGRHRDAQRSLHGINDADLFARATELRRVMAACKEDASRCPR